MTDQQAYDVNACSDDRPWARLLTGGVEWPGTPARDGPASRVLCDAAHALRRRMGERVFAGTGDTVRYGETSR